METINQLSAWLETVTLSGLVMRLIYCCIKLTHEEDEAARYKRRIRNTVTMAIIVLLIFSIFDLIQEYFGG